MHDRRRFNAFKSPVVLIALAAVTGGCGSSRPPAAPTLPQASARPSVSTPLSASPDTSISPSPRPLPSSVAYVRVAVATVWRAPEAARPVDAKALRAPADVRGWLAAMSLDQRRDLQGRADTQVLLGDRVLVKAERDGWVQVHVPDQPTPLSAAGYPGWIPRAQLTGSAPPIEPTTATVTSPTAWLYSSPGGTRAIELSFATRLPVVGRVTGWVHVAEPGGATGWLRTTATVVRSRTSSALPPNGTDVVRVARMFVGVPYLWAGTSGFGFDCSGLTYLDYRVHGRFIPRDADAQAVTGTVTSRKALRSGDLLFFAARGTVHHVGVYTGSGLMIDSPRTGEAVEVVTVAGLDYRSQYVGARRYLP